MKLATLNDGTRDGQLVVVSRDLTRCAATGDIAPTMQAALDEWARTAPQLQALADILEAGRADSRPFDQAAAHSPLPRAYQWADGSAYVNHVALVRQARGAEMPESFWTDPLMYQGGSDDFLPPRAPIPIPDEAWGIDMEAELAAITDDVPMGVSEQDAAAHIKLIMLVNDVSLRNLIPAKLPGDALFEHAVTYAEPVENLQAAFCPADGTASHRHDIIVVDDDAGDAMRRKVDGSGKANRPGANDDHRRR